MPLSESNPNRKNLTILSVLIIIYNLANGKITTEENGETALHFPLINIEFQNIEMLGNILLFILLWFLIKYWQSINSNDNFNKINDEINHSNKRNKLIIWYLKTLKKIPSQIDGIQLLMHTHEKRTEYKIRLLQNNASQGEFSLDKFNKKIVFILGISKTTITRPLILERYLPYILFLWAVYYLIIK